MRKATPPPTTTKTPQEQLIDIGRARGHVTVAEVEALLPGRLAAIQAAAARRIDDEETT